LNDSEAKTLVDADSLSIAIKMLKAKTLIVTLGEFGAIISSEESGVQMVPALRFPVEKIVDTTGAGDAHNRRWGCMVRSLPRLASANQRLREVRNRSVNHLKHKMHRMGIQQSSQA